MPRRSWLRLLRPRRPCPRRLHRLPHHQPDDVRHRRRQPRRQPGLLRDDERRRKLRRGRRRRPGAQPVADPRQDERRAARNPLLADGTTVTLPFAHAGTTVKYTLTYSVPAAPVRSVVLTDVLPAGLAYIEGSATDSADGQLMFAGYDAATRTLSWTAATLSTSELVSYRVTLLKDAAALTQPLTNSARLSSAETDPVNATSDLFGRLRRSTRTCCHRPKESSPQRRPPSGLGSLAGAGSARDPDAGPRFRHPGPGSVPQPEALGRLLLLGPLSGRSRRGIV